MKLKNILNAKKKTKKGGEANYNPNATTSEHFFKRGGHLMLKAHQIT